MHFYSKIRGTRGRQSQRPSITTTLTENFHALGSLLLIIKFIILDCLHFTAAVAKEAIWFLYADIDIDYGLYICECCNACVCVKVECCNPDQRSLKVIESGTIDCVWQLCLSRVVSEIFNVEKCRDIEIGVKGHAGSLRVVSFDRLCVISVLFSNFVPKTHRFLDIRLRKCCYLENRVKSPSRAVTIGLDMSPHRQIRVNANAKITVEVTRSITHADISF